MLAGPPGRVDWRRLIRGVAVNVRLEPPGGLRCRRQPLHRGDAPLEGRPLVMGEVLRAFSDSRDRLRQAGIAGAKSGSSGCDGEKGPTRAIEPVVYHKAPPSIVAIIPGESGGWCVQERKT